jgi:hypothetical protein
MYRQEPQQPTLACAGHLDDRSVRCHPAYRAQHVYGGWRRVPVAHGNIVPPGPKIVLTRLAERMDPTAGLLTREEKDGGSGGWSHAAWQQYAARSGLRGRAGFIKQLLG